MRPAGCSRPSSSATSTLGTRSCIRQDAAFPQQWNAYVGHYDVRLAGDELSIFARRGQLWCQDVVGLRRAALTDLGGAAFGAGAKTSQETTRFDWIAMERLCGAAPRLRLLSSGG